MLFVSTTCAYQRTICYSLQMIQIVPHTLITYQRTILLAKRKRYDSILDLKSRYISSFQRVCPLVELLGIFDRLPQA